MQDHDQPESEPGTPQPLTYEQIVGHKRPSDPRISPDGRKVLFVLRQISKSGEHSESAIWIASVSGGEPSQFTSGITEDEEPRWSPDGARVAFLSDRAERGKKSVYVMPAAGGEAVRVFDQEGDMEGLEWSPDGSLLSVLFTEPQTDAEKEREEARDDPNVWDSDYKFQRLWTVDPSDRTARCISPPARQVIGYAWSPDGQQLAINTINTPRIDDIFGRTEVLVIGKSGGEPRTVHQPVGPAASLAWTAAPDMLLWIGPAERVISPEYVYAIPVSGGDVVSLTPDYDGTVEAIIPSNGGTKLNVQTAEGFGSALYGLEFDGSLTRIDYGLSGGSLPRALSMTPDGKRIAFIWESARNVPDVWTASIGTKPTPRRLTHLNQDLEKAAIGVPELVCWDNGDGDQIEGMLYKPHGITEGTRCPLVVQVHGGPTTRWADEFTGTWHDWAHALAGRGIAVLLPNPRGSTGRGASFSNANFGDVGGGEFRDMMTGVDAMIERGIADPDRLGIGGWSWGGYMTAWTITQTDRFKAAVAGAGVSNMVSDNGTGDIPNANLSYFERSVYETPDPYWERSAMKHLSKATTPTLILHGEQDRRVAMSQSLELYTGLRIRGVETEFVTYPREPHGIMETKHQKDLIERVVNWYTKHLKA